jgi:hypothetical protein
MLVCYCKVVVNTIFIIELIKIAFFIKVYIIKIIHSESLFFLFYLIYYEVIKIKLHLFRVLKVMYLYSLYNDFLNKKFKNE